MKKVCRITVEEAQATTPPTIYVPGFSTTGTPIAVRMGHLTEQCWMASGSGDVVRYTSHKRHAHLINGLSLFIGLHNKSLRIGPFVGMFVSRGDINSM